MLLLSLNLSSRIFLKTRPPGPLHATNTPPKRHTGRAQAGLGVLIELSMEMR